MSGGKGYVHATWRCAEEGCLESYNAIIACIKQIAIIVHIKQIALIVCMRQMTIIVRIRRMTIIVCIKMPLNAYIKEITVNIIYATNDLKYYM